MYTHITKQTRIELGILLRAGVSLRGAACLLGFHHSSLSRELKRNPATQTRQRYHAGDAHRKARARRFRANQRFRKILPGTQLNVFLLQR